MIFFEQYKGSASILVSHRAPLSLNLQTFSDHSHKIYSFRNRIVLWILLKVLHQSRVHIQVQFGGRLPKKPLRNRTVHVEVRKPLDNGALALRRRLERVPIQSDV